jgi:hypothetical protein
VTAQPQQLGSKNFERYFPIYITRQKRHEDGLIISMYLSMYMLDIISNLCQQDNSRVSPHETCLVDMIDVVGLYIYIGQCIHPSKKYKSCLQIN